MGSPHLLLLAHFLALTGLNYSVCSVCLFPCLCRLESSYDPSHWAFCRKILTRLNYLLGWTVFPLTRLVEAWTRGAITTCRLVYKVHMGQTAFEWETEVIRLSISFPRATPGEDTVCRGQERVVLVLVERTVYQITTPAGPARLNMAAAGRPKRRETDSTKEKSKVILSLRPSPQFSSILRKYP